MSKGQETANTKGYPTWTGVCADCGAETTTDGKAPAACPCCAEAGPASIVSPPLNDSAAVVDSRKPRNALRPPQQPNSICNAPKASRAALKDGFAVPNRGASAMLRIR